MCLVLKGELFNAKDERLITSKFVVINIAERPERCNPKPKGIETISEFYFKFQLNSLTDF